MDKIQINVPTPLLMKLKALSRRWDKNASEIIRLAIERLIAQVPGDLHAKDVAKPQFRSFDLGRVLTPASDMRSVLNNRGDNEKS